MPQKKGTPRSKPEAKPKAPPTAAAEPTLSDLCDTLIEDKKGLQLQVELLTRQLAQRDIARSEKNSLSATTRNDLNQTTKAFAKVTDILRSASIDFHNQMHRVPYDVCEHLYCRTSREMWERLGGVELMQLALADPEAYWAHVHESTMGVMHMPIENYDTPEEEDDAAPETVAEPAAAELEPAADEEGPPLLADDLELDPKYAGKPVRRLYVPPPERQKDQDDPGFPTKAKV